MADGPVRRVAQMTGVFLERIPKSVNGFGYVKHNLLYE